MISLRHSSALAFLLYAGVSILWSPGDRLWAAGFLASLAGAYILGQRIYLRDLWQFCCGIAAILVVVTAIEPILGPNILGAALAVLLAGALTLNLWWFLPVGLVGLYLTNSRGAMIAAAVAFAVHFGRRFPVTTIGTVVLAGLYILSVDKSGPVDSTAARLGIWQDTINHLTMFGSGFGSFASAYTSWPVHLNMTATLAPHAYNDFLQLVFELGLGAIPLWLLLISIRPNLVVWTFLALGLTFSPFYIPMVAHLFALALGNLSIERTTNGSLAAYGSALSLGRRN